MLARMNDTRSTEDPLARTRQWLERAVIGLNLCPFAKAPYGKGRIRWVLSEARDPEALLQTLAAELQYLAAADPEAVETTLLVHPQVLQDFGAYNDFLDLADAAVEALELQGVLQVASFHPDYRFEGTAEDDIENCSNRSPYPTLHLLREESIDRAVAAFPQAEAIYEANQERLRALGWAGWRALWQAG